MPYFVGCAVFGGSFLCHIYFNNYFIVVWLLYVILPLLDYLMPVDHYNYPAERVRIMEKDNRFLVPLYSAWAIDFILLYWMLYSISNGTLGTNTTTFLLYLACTA